MITKYRSDIDGLRAVAVLSVILFHFFPTKFPGGFIGVDVFFVISGYLISQIIIQELSLKQFSFINFYIKRINRIFPSLIIVLLTSLLAGYFLLFKYELQELLKNIFTSSFFLSNYFYIAETGYFSKSSELNPIMHTWSLCIEEQFYLIWPLLLFLFSKNSKITFRFLILITTISFIFNLFFVYIDQISTFYSLDTRLWELSMGGILAFYKLQTSNFKLQTFSKFSSLIGFLTIILSILFISQQAIFPGFLALFPCVGTLMIISSDKKSLINKYILSNKYLVNIGLISYPLYLWHWPIISYFKIINSGQVTEYEKITSIIFCFVLAICTYIFIEKPIKKIKRNGRLSLLLVILLFTTASLSYLLSKNLPQRLNLRIAHYELNKPKFHKIETNDNSCPKNLSVEHCLVKFPSKDPTIAIIGDSHANMLYYGFSNSFAKIGENLIFLGKNRCLPFLDYKGGQVGEKETCQKNITEALNYSVNSKTIKKIILASRGPLYIYGKGLNEPDLNVEISLINKPEIKDFAKVYELAFSQTLNFLVNSKKQIIFISDNPELGFNPLTCFKRPFSTNPAKSPCAIERKEYEQRTKLVLELNNKIMLQYPSVLLFDQANHLCDSEFCYAVLNDVLLYRDDDHLSYEGANFIGSKFIDFLKSTN